MKSWLVGAFVALATGCALFGMGSEGQFRKEALPRAAREIGCDERKVNVTDLGDKRVAVEGCGQRAEYQYLEPGGWIRDTGATYDTMPGRKPEQASASASASASAPPTASAAPSAP